MNLTNIIVFSFASLGLGLLRSNRTRGWLLLIVSVLAIYWLQPPLPIRNLDFWLPTATLAIIVLVYAITLQPNVSFWAKNRNTSLALVALILTISATRYFPALCCLSPTRPPQFQQVLFGIVIIAIMIRAALHSSSKQIRLFNVPALILIGVFILLKNESFTTNGSVWLRGLTGQSQDLAASQDIQWLGFSYVSFRLLHTLRDRVSGRLPDLTLNEFVIYIIFFPAFTAGPIDRVQRFLTDLRAKFLLAAPQILTGGQRILTGLFKKFVLADSLALIALNPQNAEFSNSTLWTWIILFAYSFRIYFDFSGYTDIAVGIGQFLGIKLPENFKRPYLQPNITAFWNSWHMTLAQWFRAYFFNPLTRALRMGQRNLPMPAIIFTGQFFTMTLIGLWHGITWNFVIWGAWHGLGLFGHNRWVNFTKTRRQYVARSPNIQLFAMGSGTIATFLFVSVGWIWFVLPEPSQSWRVLQTLFRIAS